MGTTFRNVVIFSLEVVHREAVFGGQGPSRRYGGAKGVNPSSSDGDCEQHIVTTNVHHSKNATHGNAAVAAKLKGLVHLYPTAPWAMLPTVTVSGAGLLQYFPLYCEP